MSNPSFPSSLPVAIVSGYGLKAGQAFVRTEMESGPARNRRNQTSTPTTVAVSWKLNPIQYAVFEAWYEQQIDFGASWFDCRLNNGSGSQLWTVQFTKPYEGKRDENGLFWSVTAELACRNPPRLTPAQLAPYL